MTVSPVPSAIEVGPVVSLRSPAGAEARVAAHGAHAIGWRTPDGIERLYLSARSRFGDGASIRGGVPVIFPQFAAEGPLPKHGFARNRPWQRVPEQSDTRAVFELTDDASTRAIWPHAFQARLTVELGDRQLAVELAVRSTGDAPMRFTAALHSYLRVDDVAAVRIAGLRGCRYRDSADGNRIGTETRDQLTIDGEVDRIYFDAPPALALITPGRPLRVESSGFTDAVIWNPGEAKASGLADLDEDGWRRFVCIESAVIGRPVTLNPGAVWRGRQVLIAG